ncbi:hypothetical protein A6A06_24840 [Streptomyces sp. CB02923]|uniref:S1 family peptidase n=1 Tax=Streptomyces sp. CB02923 TaxID=1718985 RepID=UPI00093E5741|nr:S1 family peptidase [Streptomyces sp. CB02923]OKH98852.1 hypothetical protein A6A06_24840 [Streptomyces sp. CB02923]
MYSRRARAGWLAGILTTTVAAGALTTATAHAVAGTPVASGGYAFTAKLDIGAGKRSCSGALVDKQWVLTAASCFADDPAQGAQPAEGKPKWPTTATIGRTDLSGTGGSVVEIAELVPYQGRDVVMAKLAKPVTGVTPVAIGTTAPVAGEPLQVTGFGRTKTEWVPGKLHAGAFTVGTVQDGKLGITGKDAAVCKGDTGGPALRETGGRPELVAVNSTSWQGGCLGVDETRTDAVDARVDDLGDWVSKVRYRSVFPDAPWGKATHFASGYFTGGSAGGTRHMDLIVRWNDAEMTLYQGGDDKDAKHPFVAEYRLAAPNTPAKKSTWEYARQITGAGFGNGSDGLVVRWVDGEVTQYTHVDKNGFHGEKTLAPAKNTTWPKATQISAGRYTANAQRDDLLVVWDDGRVTLHPDLDTNGVKPASQKVLAKANGTWTHATQISAGEFTGKKTADLLVRWSDGEATIYQGIDTAGLHGEIQLRPAKSPWKNATVVDTGAFVANDRPNDVIVRWSDAALSIYPGVDAQGTHGEVQLVG